MYDVPKTKRATSLFRARIEAKARIGNMVAASKVGYRGPMPTPAEYAAATVKAATEAMLEQKVIIDGVETVADPAVVGFTLRHVPQALSTLASAAGIDSSYINPFLADAGVGFTATGKRLEDPAKLKISPGGELKVKVLEKDRAKRVTPEELLALCIEFQESVPRDPAA